MAKNITRKDGDGLDAAAIDAAIEAFKQRRAERMGAGDTGAETPPAAEADSFPPAAEEPAAPAAEEKQDAVQMVKDRRDRRDSNGDPSNLDEAMGCIAQQDEDIDTLLGVIDVLKSASPVLDSEEKEDGDENADGDEENADSDGCKKDGEGEDPAKTDKKDRADSTDFRELLRVVRVGDRLNMDGLEDRKSVV